MLMRAEPKALYGRAEMGWAGLGWAGLARVGFETIRQEREEWHELGQELRSVAGARDTASGPDT